MFDSYRGLRIFSLSRARVVLISLLFTFSILFEEISIFEVVLLDEFSEKKNTKIFRVCLANAKYNYS